jgi:hypothetical protein
MADKGRASNASRMRRRCSARTRSRSDTTSSASSRFQVSGYPIISRFAFSQSDLDASCGFRPLITASSTARSRTIPRVTLEVSLGFSATHSSLRVWVMMILNALMELERLVAYYGEFDLMWSLANGLPRTIAICRFRVKPR